ncbi:ester cyclase [Myxococcus llanfairpwllgwyngyllgogerychwyrndrobwllllantysiliogogogochensis]|uniref:Ester cyclase n=1 Tax=Myxococcus llanfairpwllgwyngyllgogerychwyrndrobwllllantysiliogogogochensis TaxID=2590453 RepID=A0A540WUZ6_9BACT|nr:ester cyclase [Myxococcus llanfairpwllgwyngyllgogerychwyrndrobwllllantysiliogogogochensis]TQF12757.1 ester cyclase [Myxococcus llanfairpwllgwyngyllgogerychwyrndrobwllllantysiliogogogochensis]
MRSPATSPKDAVRRFYAKLDEAIRTGDFDILDDVIQLDAVDHNPDPDMMLGRDGIKKGFAELRTALTDIRFTIEDLVAEGDKVACRVTTQAIHHGPFMGFAATGRKISYTVMDILRFSDDGKLLERWGLIDEATLRKQLADGQLC